jgi:hypothetical protein
MKLFLVFMLVCFFSAVLLQRHSLKLSLYISLGLALLLSVGYFFFNQI